MGGARPAASQAQTLTVEIQLLLVVGILTSFAVAAGPGGCSHALSQAVSASTRGGTKCASPWEGPSGSAGSKAPPHGTHNLGARPNPSPASAFLATFTWPHSVRSCHSRGAQVYTPDSAQAAPRLQVNQTGLALRQLPVQPGKPTRRANHSPLTGHAQERGSALCSTSRTGRTPSGPSGWLPETGSCGPKDSITINKATAGIWGPPRPGLPAQIKTLTFTPDWRRSPGHAAQGSLVPSACEEDHPSRCRVPAAMAMAVAQAMGQPWREKCEDSRDREVAAPGLKAAGRQEGTGGR